VRRQIRLLSLADGRATPFRDAPSASLDARFSPDGRSIAYVSYESGNAEIYVASLGATRSSRRLSRAGGFMPRWRADGRELYFEQPDGIIAAVDPFADVPAPQLLIHLGGMTATDSEFPRLVPSIDYDVAPDGQRFIVRLRTPAPDEGMRVAINWLPRQ
jgi:hypothetical protein